jgi:hypothetical protein
MRAPQNFVCALVTLIISFSPPATANVTAPQLGSVDRFTDLLDANRERCGEILSAVGRGVQLPLTRGLVDLQLKFARDFLQYGRDDLEQGIKHAIISYFPSSRNLFMDEAVPADALNKGSISYQLRRRGHREADRTLQSIVLLQDIIRGAPPEQFKTMISPIDPGQAEITGIRQILMDFLTDKPGVPLDDNVYKKVKVEKLHAMIVRLIFHDQGKFKQVMDEYRIRQQELLGENVELSADHDAIMHEILEKHAGTMAPEFVGLTAREKASMAKTDQIAINPGRFFQFEAPAHHILGLADLDEEAFQFWLIKEIFDLGGVKASEHPNGSHWVKPAINSYFVLNKDRAQLRGVDKKSIVAYYNKMLSTSAEKLGLKTDTDEERAVAKIALLFRLNQFPAAYDGSPLKPLARRISTLQDQFAKLSAEDRALIVKHLSRAGVDDGVAFTFGYMPEMAAQIAAKLGVGPQKQAADEVKADDGKIAYAIHSSLAMFVKVIKLAEEKTKELEIMKASSGEFTLEAQPVANFVKANDVEKLLAAELKFRLAGGNSAEITAQN